MIPIKNIYYMLSYAFKLLSERGYKSLAVEEFENTSELMAAILIKGVTNQMKRGLDKDYVQITDELDVLRGKLNIYESFNKLTMINSKVICHYEEFSVDVIKNRIIKSTLELLKRL